MPHFHISQRFSTFSLLKDKTILLLFLGIFFIVGVDVATNFISSKLMAERFDWTAEQVKFAPQVYFLSRTVGALLGAFLLARIAEMKYFRVNIVACIFSLLILVYFILRKESSHLQGLSVLQAGQEAGGAGERVRIYQSER